MRRRTFLHAAAAAVGASACAHPSPPLAAPADPGRDLASWLPVLKTPGLAAQGTVAGRPLLHLAGVRASGRADPILPTTVFSAASLTKPVFTMAVRQLVRGGKLDWKRPLQDYLPLGLTGPAAKITAEHVLSHGTGLTNWRFDPAAALESQFEPGTRWRYSGEAYVLLQRVVEHVVGAPLGRHLNTIVLPSLGMTDSTFTWTPALAASSTTAFSTSISAGGGPGSGVSAISPVFLMPLAAIARIAARASSGVPRKLMRSDGIIRGPLIIPDSI